MGSTVHHHVHNPLPQTSSNTVIIPGDDLNESHWTVQLQRVMTRKAFNMHVQEYTDAKSKFDHRQEASIQSQNKACCALLYVLAVPTLCLAPICCRHCATRSSAGKTEAEQNAAQVLQNFNTDCCSWKLETESLGRKYIRIDML